MICTWRDTDLFFSIAEIVLKFAGTPEASAVSVTESAAEHPPI